MNISLSAFVPENLISRDGFGISSIDVRPVPSSSLFQDCDTLRLVHCYMLENHYSY